MHVDGRTVGRALSERIRPFLREFGFHRFQGRNAWRRTELTVDLVSFRSMNSYTAEGVGCTTYSFGCDVGVYYPALVDGEPVEWPRDYHLTFRAGLGKTIRQPYFHPFGHQDHSDRPDVWYVLEDGSNLDEIADDAVSAVSNQGLPFISRLNDPRQAMRSLLSEEGSNPGFGTLGLMAGGLGSPSRMADMARLSSILD
ncbi:hypothetical protein BJY17_001885 [Agromyces hippuratus]|uniref:DUF4304 domain-containing protein n=1 Tax=Agromyces hippuratus TaxID=286438 RepID=A0A852WUA4_9MICO|nr:hypothetical protein [Agromyces hippuratus]NYG21138.1 hypothetical protein [Agromyces hippuratus]